MIYKTKHRSAKAQEMDRSLFSKSLKLFAFLLILFLLAFFGELKAQDSLKTTISYEKKATEERDSIKKRGFLNNYFKEDYPSPKKAIILAIVPGMGQIYNKKYWKLPLVYGALGGVIYAINYNTRNYKRLRETYEAKTIPGSHAIDYFPSIPESAIKARRNSFDKNRQLSWIGLFGFYLISAGDAFVDAHLKTFDIDDDISVRPVIHSTANGPPTLGLGLTIKLSQ